MKPEDRQQWILNWMRQRPTERVDVLNADFVDAYAAHTKAKTLPQFFGAAKCSQLGRDLSALKDSGHLQRTAIGLPSGDASMGFPKWIYCYRF